MPEQEVARKCHVVGIVGGAVSGSVAAHILAERGSEVVVFEQNERPYGKIEDGLPRWHTKLRKQEYKKIDERLKHPRIHYVPRTRLGRDLAFEELATGWGLSALLLANGAWRDRPIDVAGVDDYVGRGLAYQNPFIYWFNHKSESAYAGPRYEVPDGTLCVGGGLASIDVIKVIQIEIYQRALRLRGFDVPMLDLEHEGIPTICKKKGIDDPRSLAVTDGTLVYRRRAEDMPLADSPADATSEQLKKAEGVRKKILEVCRRKFLFRFEERKMSRQPLIEGNRLVGLLVADTRVEGRKVEPVPGSEREFRTQLVVSSIGSVPEKVPGIRMNGETYAFKSWDTGEYDGLSGVFGLGNVVTGKGNIRDSLDHGEFVAKHVAEYLGIGDSRDVPEITVSAEGAGSAAAARVDGHLASRGPLPPGKAHEILDRVRGRQRAVGYEGDYAAWMAQVTPPDLE